MDDLVVTTGRVSRLGKEPSSAEDVVEGVCLYGKADIDQGSCRSVITPVDADAAQYSVSQAQNSFFLPINCVDNRGDGQSWSLNGLL